MTLTTLDPKPSLIVIDLQKGIVSLPAADLIEPVVRHAADLAAAFRRCGFPVVLVNVDGGAPGRTDQARRLQDVPPGWTDLIPALDAQPEDHRVTKRTWGAFSHTDLEAHLTGLGVTQVVIVGVATSAGVESTARQAYELGFNVVLAIDAMTDLNLDAHANSLMRIFPRLGETATTREILDRLAVAQR
jgi:nicotinamidase-related amidase